MLLCLYMLAAPSWFYTLSLHDALPISRVSGRSAVAISVGRRYQDSHRGQNGRPVFKTDPPVYGERRSEEHTSELQSRGHLLCRHLPEKKKIIADSSLIQLQLPC